MEVTARTRAQGDCSDSHAEHPNWFYMKSILASVLVAAAMLSIPNRADAQLAVGFKYMFNEPIVADTGYAEFAKFAPIGRYGGGPQSCLSPTPGVGQPDNVLFAPAMNQRKIDIYLFYDYAPAKLLTNVQIIRHESPLPMRDSASNDLVTDPFTALTDHTVFLLDLVDSTMVAYNRRGGVAQRGVAGKLSDLRKLPLVQETLQQIDESTRLCRMHVSQK